MVTRDCDTNRPIGKNFGRTTREGCCLANGQNFSRSSITTQPPEAAGCRRCLRKVRWEDQSVEWNTRLPSLGKKERWKEERKLTFPYDIYAAFMKADFETRICPSDNNSKKHLGHMWRFPGPYRSVVSILRDNFMTHLIE